MLLELADHLVVLDEEPVLGEEAEDLGEEVARLLVLVERRVAIRLESGAHGVGRLAQVVVRDLGEEQVVDHMAIGDVVVEVIDPQAKGTIDRLKRAAHIRPGALLDQVRIQFWTDGKSGGATFRERLNKCLVFFVFACSKSTISSKWCWK